MMDWLAVSDNRTGLGLCLAGTLWLMVLRDGIRHYRRSMRLIGLVELCGWLITTAAFFFDRGVIRLAGDHAPAWLTRQSLVSEATLWAMNVGMIVVKVALRRGWADPMTRNRGVG